MLFFSPSASLGSTSMDPTNCGLKLLLYEEKPCVCIEYIQTISLDYLLNNRV